jgi:hypothetical protein
MSRDEPTLTTSRRALPITEAARLWVEAAASGMTRDLPLRCAAHNKFWDPILTWEPSKTKIDETQTAVAGATSMTEGRVKTSMPWQRSYYFGLFMGRYA